MVVLLRRWEVMWVREGGAHSTVRSAHKIAVVPNMCLEGTQAGTVGEQDAFLCFRSGVDYLSKRYG